jgi:hypothetical protein
LITSVRFAGDSFGYQGLPSAKASAKPVSKRVALDAELGLDAGIFGLRPACRVLNWGGSRRGSGVLLQGCIPDEAFAGIAEDIC